MGNNAEYIDGYGSLTLQQALDIARNSERGVDPRINAHLERKISELWSKLNAQPNTYIFTKDEGALFTYYRQRFHGSPVAQQAVARFWNHYHGS
ncbi:hypothetical protein EJ04DRAFT_171350 [Polyplosphaeria fusca]|uniref:Uncharacterized protein n=1 Tax=Polyplosphaeria fusca TaxID=682080 RepID=A0A9P4R3Q3_9PLEO|nr:hypothetical protein EJ04DRAFT_171350 [Polyplosphaeria fusca]